MEVEVEVKVGVEVSEAGGVVHISCMYLIHSPECIFSK